MFDLQHITPEGNSFPEESETTLSQPKQKTKKAPVTEQEPKTNTESEKKQEVAPEHLDQKDDSEEKTAEPKTGPEKNEVSQITDSKKAKQIKETQASKNSREVVADKYQNKKTYRHDNLAQQQSKNDLSSMMQSKPITDLTKAIGVNDKFLFIRELFDGNREHYHEAIQLLNEIPTFEEAQTYLHETFNWNWEDPVTKKFIELIKRKFVENQD